MPTELTNIAELEWNSILLIDLTDPLFLFSFSLFLFYEIFGPSARAKLKRLKLQEYHLQKKHNGLKNKNRLKEFLKRISRKS